MSCSVTVLIGPLPTRRAKGRPQFDWQDPSPARLTTNSSPPPEEGGSSVTCSHHRSKKIKKEKVNVVQASSEHLEEKSQLLLWSFFLSRR